MFSFENDYLCGAHPLVLQKLMETNLVQQSGYGSDEYCLSAAEKICRAAESPEADVFFLAGGTQTNAVVIASMLRPWQGVLCAQTGHIHVHEAGAVEYTGHKVLALPQYDGKVKAADAEAFLKSFYADSSHDHMVFPGMLYISHPTEYGTLYTLSELEELSRLCRGYEIPLFMDGARLGYGLMSWDTDVTLADIARLCDVFYIGGTKVGALCGEAVVFPRRGMPRQFLTMVKQHGALLAKGRVLGAQFDALFTDDLYFSISRHACLLAQEMREIFLSRGYPLYMDSPTNQQFIILTPAQKVALEEKVGFTFWERMPDGRTVVRFATSWATTREDLQKLSEILDSVDA